MLSHPCTSCWTSFQDNDISHPPYVVRERGDLPRQVPGNIRIKYMYRDGSNYKLHGEAIFTNQSLLPPADIEKQIRSCLRDREYFIARQVNLEERFFDVLHDDDHPWHEFEAVEETTETAFDPENWNQCRYRRDVVEFIADLRRAQHVGWDEMNVRPDVARLLERQKAEFKRAHEEGRDLLDGADDE